MIGDLKENVIEWLSGDKEVTVTFSQKKFVNKIKKMAEKHPELVEIRHENADGSIVAHIPLKAVHLTIYDKKMGGFTSVQEEGEDDDSDIWEDT